MESIVDKLDNLDIDKQPEETKPEQDPEMSA